MHVKGLKKHVEGLDIVYIYILYQGLQHALKLLFFIIFLIWRPGMLLAQWPKCPQHVLKKEKC
jgi:hypothetical protein